MDEFFLPNIHFQEAILDKYRNNNNSINHNFLSEILEKIYSNNNNNNMTGIIFNTVEMGGCDKNNNDNNKKSYTLNCLHKG